MGKVDLGGKSVFSIHKCSVGSHEMTSFSLDVNRMRFMIMLPWYFCVLAFLCLRLAAVARGHARLMSPPSRSSMWRLGFPTETNFNDNALYCGGIQVQWQKNGGKCGICGDPYDMPYPRDNEAGGKYGQGIITRSYLSGQLIEAIVDVSTNHKGYFEFKICPNNNPKKEASQECLDKHTLKLEQGGTKYYITDKGNGDFAVMLRLPKGLACSQCVFQWTYVSGNNWGRCADGESRLGCGPQETFRGCADIAIIKNPNFFTYNPSQNDIGYKFHATTLYKSSKQKLYKESSVTKYPKYTTEISSQILENKSTFTTQDITPKPKSSKRKRPFSSWMTTDINERTAAASNKTNYKLKSLKRSTNIENRNGYYFPTTQSSFDSKLIKDRLSLSRSPSVLVIEKGSQLSKMLEQLEGEIQLLRFYLQEDPATSTHRDGYETSTKITGGATKIVKDFWYL